jgi:hypothetical protein
MYVAETINYLYVLFQLSQVFSIWNTYIFKCFYFKLENHNVSNIFPFESIYINLGDYIYF